MRLAFLAGGLKMVDIEVFMKSLKITWIRRLFRYNNAPWIKLLQAETSICLTKISHFGSQYLSEMIRTVNPFWQDVFVGWIAMSANLRIDNNIDLLTVPLWYNPLISAQPLYLPDWYQKGVIMVADVVSYKKVISYEELCQKFSTQFSYRNYLAVKCKINILLTKFGHAFENIILERPFVAFNLKYILKRKKGVGTIYRIFQTNF